MKDIISTTPQRTLGAFAIWAIGVGLVISGESFGWNLGWAETGAIGFFISVFLMAVMYYALIQCKIELACVYPEAEGPHTHVKNAFGKTLGDFIALAVLLEFLCAAPAVANAIGEYLGFLNDNTTIQPWIAATFITLFCLLSLVNFTINLYLVFLLTFLAIFELLIYSGAVAGSFDINNLFDAPNNQYNFMAIVKSIPYAIWLYLAIEGISLETKNIKSKDFRKHIFLGYNTAFWTLSALLLMVLILTAGSIDWTKENWDIMAKDSHPLPASMAIILTKNNLLVKIFTFLGLFGLIASLQGIITAASTQLVLVIKMINPKIRYANIIAAFVIFVVSLTAVLGSTVSFLIEITVLGAVFMYFFVCLSLFKLRLNKSPDTVAYEGISTNASIKYKHSDFNGIKSNFYSLLTMVLSLFALIISIYFHHYTFWAFMLVSGIYVLIRGNLRHCQCPY